LRNNGYIKKLVDAKNAARDLELSLDEAKKKKKKVKYGFGTYWSPGFAFGDEGGGGDGGGGESRIHESPDGVNPTTKMFLEQPEDQNEITVREFIDFVVDQLGINDLPEIVLHNDPAWSEQNHSFGRYTPEMHTLEVNLANRHIMDVLRTTAHELVHCKQNQEHALPDQAGDTGSRWENEANAMAGVIMRDYAEHNPRMFENASGYIPRNKKEARDPRYSMAVTVDIKPGQVGKEANKLGLQTGRNGEPQLLMKTANTLAESLAQELTLFEEDLFEINMGSKNLRREAAKTGAIAGMEFEMIVPNVEGGEDEDQEPDYEYDQRCRSIQDAYDFFYDGDFNSRRSCDAMRDEMRNDYVEWLDDKISEEWDSQGDDYVREWVANNVDEEEWNNGDDDPESSREERLDNFAANVRADPGSDYYQSAYEEFREENQESWDESDWLDAEDLDLMSYVENRYSMSWPHWTSGGGSGEAEISDVAQEFENAIGRDTRASDNYHSGSVTRPSPTSLRYVVEPDGSLEPDNSSDRGLEFVSPPLPIDEILSDLNKVRAWAKEYGCYTNDSTGLHINISVPDYSRENLDFVKLALLMGDKYVLDAFGRTGNTYAKSALGIIKDAVRNKPEDAARLLDKMKGNLDQLATKAIHSGITSKYTSINTKDGHIEFRSPGGDWLGDNFDQIENTLLRFTVAMSAALNPEMYRQEYLTKLYKLLSENDKGNTDTIKYFSEYVAGKIPQAALRSFVKQAQLQRSLAKGKVMGPMWWNVQWDNNRRIEVVAGSAEVAKQVAAEEWGVPESQLAGAVVTPLRPYKEEPKGPTLNGRPSNPDGNYVIIDQANPTRPVYRYMASDSNDGLLVLRQWISANRGATQWTFKHDPDQSLGQPGGSADADQGDSTNPLRPTGPGPWEVYNRQTGNSTVNLIQDGQPITDRAQAQRQAMALISTGPHDLYGVRTIGTGSRANIGTQTDMENRLGLPSQSVTANYAVVDRFNTNPVFRFRADDRRDANRIYGEWLAAAGLPTTTEDYGFQEIRPQIPEVPLDIEIAPPRSPAQPAPAGNSFSGQWKVMIDGEEVWRFRGVGNNQADANRIAQTWILDQIRNRQLSPVDGADVEVLPVMI
jgi:hypothetical protein